MRIQPLLGAGGTCGEAFPIPGAQPVAEGNGCAVLRVALKPGQSIGEHPAPSGGLQIIVLEGEGFFSGGDREERKCVRGAVLCFEPGELHRIRADRRRLVFASILHHARNGKGG